MSNAQKRSPKACRELVSLPGTNAQPLRRLRPNVTYAVAAGDRKTIHSVGIVTELNYFTLFNNLRVNIRHTQISSKRELTVKLK